MLIRFALNGRTVEIDTDPLRRVVDVLREDLKLTGTKEGCGTGECGACTILVNGESRLSCLMSAFQLEGSDIVTIEGMSRNGVMHPLQEAFKPGHSYMGYPISRIAPDLHKVVLHTFRKPVLKKTAESVKVSG